VDNSGFLEEAQQQFLGVLRQISRKNNRMPDVLSESPAMDNTAVVEHCTLGKWTAISTASEVRHSTLGDYSYLGRSLRHHTRGYRQIYFHCQPCARQSRQSSHVAGIAHHFTIGRRNIALVKATRFFSVAGGSTRQHRARCLDRVQRGYPGRSHYRHRRGNRSRGGCQQRCTAVYHRGRGSGASH
jgi:hypothetical protein